MMKIKGSGNSEERQAPEREQFRQSQFPSPSPTTPSRRAACTVASGPAPLALSHQIVSPSPLCVSLLYSASSLSPLLFLKPQPLPMSGPRTSKQCGQTPHPLHVPLPLPRPLPYPLRLSMSAPRTHPAHSPHPPSGAPEGGGTAPLEPALPPLQPLRPRGAPE